MPKPKASKPGKSHKTAEPHKSSELQKAVEASHAAELKPNASARSHWSFKKKVFLGLLATLGSGILLVVLAIAILSQQPEHRLLQHFTAAGLSAPQASSYEEWIESIREQGEARLTQTFNLSPSPDNAPLASSFQDLGLSVDWEAWEAQAQARLSTLSTVDKVLVFVKGWNLSPNVSLDPTLTEEVLSHAHPEQAVADARFEVQSGAKVTIVPEQVGYQKPTDFAWVLEAWQQPQALETVTIPFVITSPQRTAAQLQNLLPVAQALAPQTLIFKSEDGQSWSWKMSEHLDLLTSSETQPWSLDQDRFKAALTSTLGTLEHEPAAATITQDAEGKITFEGSARFGQKIDHEALFNAVMSALKGPDNAVLTSTEALSIPLTQTDPQVTVPEDLKAQGITELVGVGYSDFKGSPANRIHNIQTGIAQYNGIVIPQGKEFSFMEQMSPVDGAHGFLPELVIKGDETVPEYGGGLCQISSTMFRAALYSGLPITARKNHSYAVAYYARPFGYGLDATVYDPAPDFRFINDTPAALLVQAYTEGNSAYYVFYGTNDHRTVKMEGPYNYDYNSIAAPVVTLTDKLAPGVQEVKEHGHTGFKTDWYRTVTYPKDSTSPYATKASGVRENIHSVYEARPQKVWEGQSLQPNSSEVQSSEGAASS